MRLRLFKKERGQSMVEFGLLIGFLVAMIIGGIDIGLAIHNVLVMQDAVSRGAQVAAMGGSDEQIEDAIYDYLLYVPPGETFSNYLDNILLISTFGDSGIMITPPGTERGEDSTVTVAIDYQVGMAFGPMLGEFYIWDFPVTHTTTVELPPPVSNNLPVEDGFEDGLASWDVYQGGGTAQLNTVNPYVGLKCAEFVGNSKNDNSTMTITVNNGTASNITISWYWGAAGTVDNSGGGEDFLYIDYSEDGGTNWTNAYVQNGNSTGGSGASSYEEKSCNITGITANTIYVRFRVRLTGTDEYYYIDSVSIDET